MNNPFVSFVIPTLNAERLLPACLGSIRLQDYGSDNYEILVADGGSSDRTREIAAQFGCRLVEATGLLAEASKKLCFQAARGEYLVMLDADNEIASSDWLRRAMLALVEHPDALAYESYYLKHPKDCHLNRFLSGCLQISDPLADAMATLPKLQKRTPEGIEEWELPHHGGYPTGANGFIFRKALLVSLGTTPYHEAAFFPSLMQKGYRQLIKIKGCGVHHHYVSGWRDFYRKRRRSLIIYKLRQHEVTCTWDHKMGWKGKFRLLWVASVIGPLLQSVYLFMRDHDWEWFLYAPSSAVSVMGNMAGLFDLKRSRSKTDNHNQAYQLSRKS